MSIEPGRWFLRMERPGFRASIRCVWGEGERKLAAAIAAVSAVAVATAVVARGKVSVAVEGAGSVDAGSAGLASVIISSSTLDLGSPL